MTVSNIARDGLLHIADKMEIVGHFQGQKTEVPGSYCPPGSCCIVYQTDLTGEVIDEVTDALNDHLGFSKESRIRLFDWNDNTPTAEVIATLRTVADSL